MKLLDRYIRRIPLINLFYRGGISYPTPSNLSYLWNFGVYLLFSLLLQLMTRIFLSMRFLINFLSLVNISVLNYLLNTKSFIFNNILKSCLPLLLVNDDFITLNIFLEKFILFIIDTGPIVTVVISIAIVYSVYHFFISPRTPGEKNDDDDNDSGKPVGLFKNRKLTKEEIANIKRMSKIQEDGERAFKEINRELKYEADMHHKFGTKWRDYAPPYRRK